MGIMKTKIKGVIELNNGHIMIFREVEQRERKRAKAGVRSRMYHKS